MNQKTLAKDENLWLIAQCCSQDLGRRTICRNFFRNTRPCSPEINLGPRRCRALFLVGFNVHFVWYILPNICSYYSHHLVLWAYYFIFVALLLEEHSNHDVWWSPGNWIPSIFGGAVPHDVHHVKVKTNYGFVFTIWDWMFGTYTSPSSLKD